MFLKLSEMVDNIAGNNSWKFQVWKFFFSKVRIFTGEP